MCVNFSIKTCNWSQTRCPLYPFLLCCLKCQYSLQGEERNTLIIFIINHHMMAALVTFHTKSFHFQSPLRHKRLYLSGFKCLRDARLPEEVKATLCMFLLNNAYSLHLSQPADKQRGGPVISGFTELLNASWEEGEILRGRVLRKALIITFSFEPSCAMSYTFFYCGAGCNHKCYQIKGATVT